MDSKVKHLELIQEVISRIGGNLFILKGWTITLVIALLTLAAKDTKGFYLLFAFISILIFWLLDGYFLSVERCYRGLYDSVRKKKDKDINFSMDYSPFYRGKNTWAKAMFSKTLLIFYGVLLITLMLAVNTFKIKKIQFTVLVDHIDKTSTLEQINEIESNK